MANNENKSNFVSSYFVYLNRYRSSIPVPVLELQEERDISSLQSKIKDLSGIDFTHRNFDAERYAKLSKSDKSRLLALLMKLYNLTKDEVLLEMIEQIKEEIERKEDNNKQTSGAGSDTKPTEQSNTKKTVETQIIENKAKNYADWSFEKFKDSSFTATKKPVLDTRSLDNLSRNQLVSMFKPNVFYSLSDRQKQVLFQAVANNFLLANGVSPCAVELVNLPHDSKSVCFGEYVPAKGTIYLNSHLLSAMDAMYEEGNTALPYKILSTIIHEAQHRVQFMNFDKQPRTEAERLLKASLIHPNASKSFADYLSEPDEIDARNTALAYIRECANNCEKPDEALALATFYNAEKERELSNGKKPVQDALMQSNRDVYSASMLKVPMSAQAQMRNGTVSMYQTLCGRGLDLGKNLSKTNFKKP